MGKIANCQAGVYLGYSSGQGYCLLDRRLFMPEWLESARSIAPSVPGVQVFDPVRAPMLKKAGLERAQLWMQSESRMSLQQFLRDWMPKLYARPASSIRWHLDVDPAEN